MDQFYPDFQSSVVSMRSWLLRGQETADTSVQYDTFTRSETFEMMAFIGGQGPSFENPHNGVHDLAGCSNGTLQDLNWSAFDPLLYVCQHFYCPMLALALPAPTSPILLLFQISS